MTTRGPQLLHILDARSAHSDPNKLSLPRCPGMSTGAAHAACARCSGEPGPPLPFVPGPRRARRGSSRCGMRQASPSHTAARLRASPGHDVLRESLRQSRLPPPAARERLSHAAREGRGAMRAPPAPPPSPPCCAVLTEPGQPLHQPRGAEGSGAVIHSSPFLRDKERGNTSDSAARSQVREPRRGGGAGRPRHPAPPATPTWPLESGAPTSATECARRRGGSAASGCARSRRARVRRRAMAGRCCRAPPAPRSLQRFAPPPRAAAPPLAPPPPGQRQRARTEVCPARPRSPHARPGFFHCGRRAGQGCRVPAPSRPPPAPPGGRGQHGRRSENEEHLRRARWLPHRAPRAPVRGAGALLRGFAE